jgi:3-phenylpropionate/trans-cinnamate dioxygenase ferredoxin reductase component
MSEAGVIIIGAGECGGRAALALREAGFSLPVTIIGDEPHAPYERPPLSKGSLDDVDGVSQPKWIADAGTFASRGITLLTSAAATHVDRARKTVSLSHGRTMSYAKLLLATGARPRALPGLPFDGSKVLALRTHADALALRPWLRAGHHIAILGGGFIGLELAATARQAGAEVTVIEGQPRVLMRGVAEPLALLLQKRHLAEGVDLRLGAKIDHVKADADRVRILLSGEAPIEADILLIGIGAVPNTELALDAGLAVDNGIVVDQTLRTSDPDIYAAGDCCNFPISIYGGRRMRLESWRNAGEQAVLAAANIMGADRAFSTVPWFWSDQYDLSLQVAGLMDEATTIIERPLGDESLVLFHLAADGRLVAASGLGLGNAVARDIRLAEMLIAARVAPNPAVLGDPASKLKNLLKAA